jgi:hypothetical protein
MKFMNGQEQKFNDAPKFTTLPESLVLPQIKKDCVDGSNESKLMNGRQYVISFTT